MQPAVIAVPTGPEMDDGFLQGNTGLILLGGLALLVVVMMR